MTIITQLWSKRFYAVTENFIYTYVNDLSVTYLISSIGIFPVTTVGSR